MSARAPSVRASLMVAWVGVRIVRPLRQLTRGVHGPREVHAVFVETPFRG